MSRFAFLFALASLVAATSLAEYPAHADWRGAIAGSRPILPARFVPRQSPHLVSALPGLLAAPQDPAADAAISWIAPLVDQRLSATQKSADLAPELLDAIMRIEPIFDPTRLEGPEVPVGPSVAPGTAAMNNVFADRWDRADTDANVSQRVPYVAMAWMRRGALPCGAFMKRRARAGYERPALSALTRSDCDALLRHEAAPAAEGAALTPVVVGWVAVPIFAAPLPGSRLSSVAFWAARRAEIARVEADLRLRQAWHGGMQGVSRTLARR